MERDKFGCHSCQVARAHWVDASEEQISSSCSSPSAWTPPTHHLKPAPAGAELNFRLYTKLWVNFVPLWDISVRSTPTKFISTLFQPHLMLIPPGNIGISPATLQGWPRVGSLGEGNILARFRINSGGPIGQPLFVGAFSICPSIKAYYYFVNLFLRNIFICPCLIISSHGRGFKFNLMLNIKQRLQHKVIFRNSIL